MEKEHLSIEIFVFLIVFVFKKKQICKTGIFKGKQKIRFEAEKEKKVL